MSLIHSVRVISTKDYSLAAQITLHIPIRFCCGEITDQFDDEVMHCVADEAHPMPYQLAIEFVHRVPLFKCSSGYQAYRAFRCEKRHHIFNAALIQREAITMNEISDLVAVKNFLQGYGQRPGSSLFLPVLSPGRLNQDRCPSQEKMLLPSGNWAECCAGPLRLFYRQCSRARFRMTGKNIQLEARARSAAPRQTHQVPSCARQARVGPWPLTGASPGLGRICLCDIGRTEWFPFRLVWRAPN